MLYLSSDHAGFDLKRRLKKYLDAKGVSYEDLGPDELDKSDDYPDFALPLAQKVASDPQSRGILICGNGVGVSMVANKVKGIRAALSWDSRHTATARADDNANVLALPARFIHEDRAKEVIKAFLETEFSGAERHKRRLKKVEGIEE